jgi:hypothetical protein
MTEVKRAVVSELLAAAELLVGSTESGVRAAGVILAMRAIEVLAEANPHRRGGDARSLTEQARVQMRRAAEVMPI